MGPRLGKEQSFQQVILNDWITTPNNKAEFIPHTIKKERERDLKMDQ